MKPAKENNVSEPSAIVPSGGIDFSAAIASATALGKDGVEVLERLHGIIKEERAAAARAAYAKAVADLHARIGSIAKNRTASFATKAGGKVSYKYADLHAIATALRKHTGPLGLSWRWATSGDDSGVTVTCTASHRDGHSESSTWRAPVETGNPMTSAPQKAKIATTFAQRVTLIQVFGLTDTEDDVDGAMPEDAADEDGSVVLIDAATAANLVAMFDEAPDPAGEKARFLRWIGADAIDAIPASRAREAVAAVEAKRKKGWRS